MSYTDQVFIKAYQTDARSAAPAAAAVRTHEHHGHGPHAHFSAPKRPLSEAMSAAAKHEEPHSHPPTGAAAEIPLAGVTLAAFSVPAVAAQLAQQCGDDYRRMLSYASRSGEVIGFLGAGVGVGCSTTTLAAGLAVGSMGRAAAVIDAAPGEAGLASSLGLLRAPSLAEVIARGGAAGDALFHSLEENLSVGIAFASTGGDERRVSGALRSLTATHAAVLVDLGCDIESIATHPAQGADSLRLDAVVIVRQANLGEADVMFARRVLAASGHTVVGVIESFAT